MAAQLAEMGFSLEQSETALELTNGNIDAALNFLLGGDLPQQPQPSIQTQTAISPSSAFNDVPFAQDCECIQSDISQFSFPDGRSACTAISCEAAISLMDPSRPPNISPELIRRIIEDGVGFYGQISQQGGVEHTAADEILPIIPRFTSHLRRTSDPFVTIQGLLTNQQCFMSIFEQARNTQGVDPTQPIAVVITKPPETVVVIMPPLGQADSSWYLFDSHSRPQFGLTGGYLVTAPSAETLISSCLRVVFPAVDLDDGVGGQPSFMAEMYNSVEAIPMQFQSPKQDA